MDSDAPPVLIISDTQGDAHAIVEGLCSVAHPPRVEVFLHDASIARRLDALAARPGGIVIVDFARPWHHPDLLRRLGTAPLKHAATTIALIPMRDEAARSACAAAGLAHILPKPEHPSGLVPFMDRLRAIIARVRAASGANGG
jgi:hypothetical protein